MLPKKCYSSLFCILQLTSAMAWLRLCGGVHFLETYLFMRSKKFSLVIVYSASPLLPRHYSFTRRTFSKKTIHLCSSSRLYKGCDWHNIIKVPLRFLTAIFFFFFCCIPQVHTTRSLVDWNLFQLLFITLN